MLSNEERGSGKGEGAASMGDLEVTKESDWTGRSGLMAAVPAVA